MKVCCYNLYNNRKKFCIKCKKKLINSTNKNLIENLPNDIIQYILKLYLKSKNMFFYSNLSLVSKSFNYNFNILYKYFQYIPYNINNLLKKNIYFVTSKKFSIKFAKLYFCLGRDKFNLLFGEENMELSKHKSYFYNDSFYISKLLDFYIVFIK